MALLGFGWFGHYCALFCGLRVIGFGFVRLLVCARRVGASFGIGGFDGEAGLWCVTRVVVFCGAI